MLIEKVVLRVSTICAKGSLRSVSVLHRDVGVAFPHLAAGDGSFAADNVLLGSSHCNLGFNDLVLDLAVR